MKTKYPATVGCGAIFGPKGAPAELRRSAFGRRSGGVCGRALGRVGRGRGLLGGVALEPLRAAQVGQVGYLELLEADAEALAVGAGGHRAHHHRRVVL